MWDRGSSSIVKVQSHRKKKVSCSRRNRDPDLRIQVLTSKMNEFIIDSAKNIVLNHLRPYRLVDGDIINENNVKVDISTDDMAVCTKIMSDLKDRIRELMKERQGSRYAEPTFPPSPENFPSDENAAGSDGETPRDMICRDSANPLAPAVPGVPPSISTMTQPTYEMFVWYISEILIRYCEFEYSSSSARGHFRHLADVLGIPNSVWLNW